MKETKCGCEVCFQMFDSENEWREHKTICSIPSPQPEEWEENYEIIKSSFLAYNPQSGSRFLNDDVLKPFIANEIRKAEERGRNSVLGTS